MMEQGISVRCMVTVLMWVSAAVVGLGAILFDSDAVGRIGIVLACGGMTFVILNDNARTRRLLRVSLCEALEGRDRPPITVVPRVD